MEKTSTCKLGNHCCTLKLVTASLGIPLFTFIHHSHQCCKSSTNISSLPILTFHSLPVSNSSLSHSTEQPFTFQNSLLYLLMSIPCPSLPLLHLLALQGGGSYSTGRTECVGDEATERQGGEVCLPGRGQPHDETHHQLTLQKQGGVYV